MDVFDFDSEEEDAEPSNCSKRQEFDSKQPNVKKQLSTDEFRNVRRPSLGRQGSSASARRRSLMRVKDECFKKRPLKIETRSFNVSPSGSSIRQSSVGTEHGGPLHAYMEQSGNTNETAEVRLRSNKAWIGGLLVDQMRISFTAEVIGVQISANMQRKSFELRVEEAEQLLSHCYETLNVKKAVGVLVLKETAKVDADVVEHFDLKSTDLRLRSIVWELNNDIWVAYQREILSICGLAGSSDYWERLALGEKDEVSFFLERPDMKPGSDRTLLGNTLLEKELDKTDLVDSEPLVSNSLEQRLVTEVHPRNENVWTRREAIQDFLFPNGNDRDAVTVTNEDFKRLGPGMHLNDTLIDFYIKYVNMQLPSEQQERYHFFNSFFYTKLLEGQASDDFFKGVASWTRKVDIFSKDFVFVPINQWSHWSLAIICHLKEIASFQEIDKKMEGVDSDRSPSIIHLDSMEGFHSEATRLLLNYLREEWSHRFHTNRSETAQLLNRIKCVRVNVPQQTNSSDCGLFLLHYVELFAKRNPPAVCLLEGHPHFPHYLNGRWFQPCEASSKRDKIREVIFELSRQSQALEKTKPCKLETKVGGDLCILSQDSSDVLVLSQPPKLDNSTKDAEKWSEKVQAERTIGGDVEEPSLNVRREKCSSPEISEKDMELMTEKEEEKSQGSPAFEESLMLLRPRRSSFPQCRKRSKLQSDIPEGSLNPRNSKRFSSLNETRRKVVVNAQVEKKREAKNEGGREVGSAVDVFNLDDEEEERANPLACYSTFPIVTKQLNSPVGNRDEGRHGEYVPERANLSKVDYLADTDALGERTEEGRVKVEGDGGNGKKHKRRGWDDDLGLGDAIIKVNDTLDRIRGEVLKSKDERG